MVWREGARLTRHKLLLLASGAELWVEFSLEPGPIPLEVLEGLLRERPVGEAVEGYGLASHLRQTDQTVGLIFF